MAGAGSASGARSVAGAGSASGARSVAGAGSARGRGRWPGRDRRRDGPSAGRARIVGCEVRRGAGIGRHGAGVGRRVRERLGQDLGGARALPLGAGRQHRRRAAGVPPTGDARSRRPPGRECPPTRGSTGCRRRSPSSDDRLGGGSTSTAGQECPFSSLTDLHHGTSRPEVKHQARVPRETFSGPVGMPGEHSCRPNPTPATLVGECQAHRSGAAESIAATPPPRRRHPARPVLEPSSLQQPFGQSRCRSPGLLRLGQAEARRRP